MFRLNLISAAAVAVVLATGAKAADMPVYYEPEPVEYKSWYLRGDIGASHQVVDDFSSPFWDTIAAGPDTLYLMQDDFDASFFIAGGVGYRVNDWFRVDVTGEYRFESDFHGLDNIDVGSDGSIDQTNQFTGTKEEAVFLFNAYYDLPSWGKMTPYIGAGVGASWIKLSDFTDTNPLGISGFSDDVDSWNLAWAAYAGLSFDITEQLVFDVGYRFLYLGSVDTDDLLDAGGGNATYNPFEFNDIYSHDIKVGLRYAFY